MDRPSLKYLHAEAVLSPVKLEVFRRASTSELRATLAPEESGSLKVRRDGTILDGHHRLFVLAERGEDIHSLPREIIEKRDET